MKGVKKGDAERDFTKELLSEGRQNLLTIKPKAALIFELQEEKNESILELLKKHGLEMVKNHSLEIR